MISVVPNVLRIGCTTLLLTCLLSTGCMAAVPAARRVRQPTVGVEQLMTTGSGYIYHWDRFPISISLNEDAELRYNTEIIEAVEYWNTVIGENIFHIVPNNGDIQFLEYEFTYDAMVDTLIFGMADVGDSGRYRNGVLNKVKIYLDIDIPAGYERAVIIHEIGHALGLRHDSGQPCSLMYPDLWDATKQALTNEDLTAIRSQVARFHTGN